MWRVQAQVSCTTLDGWQSSRQVKTMDIAAHSSSDAVRAVSDVVWDARSPVMPDTRRTYATVVEIDHLGSPIGNPHWVRVAYRHGGIETVSGSTYASVKEEEEEETGHADR